MTATTLTAKTRLCEECQVNIDHKRRDARFCTRKCKTAKWFALNRATPEGRASEKAREAARYKRDGPKRRQIARDVYWRNRDVYIERSRKWRKEHPERRRVQQDRRADLMRSNPGFTPFGNAEWERLKRRFNHRCAYCGERGALTQDHVIPLSRGGRHAIANILPACHGCNVRKSQSLLVEWRLRLEGG